jgi:hypothetical protein
MVEAAMWAGVEKERGVRTCGFFSSPQALFLPDDAGFCKMRAIFSKRKTEHLLLFSLLIH